MKNFWRGFRKTNYIDENKVRVQRQARKRFMELVQLGHAAEPEFRQALKVWQPKLTNEEIEHRVRQFHDCVNVTQPHGPQRH